MGAVAFRRIGAFEVWALSAGRFRMDGGTMFGVVPRESWARRMPPDGRNRVLLGLTCLLVRTPSETVLVETGHGGEKLPGRLRDAYALDDSAGLDGPMAEAGVDPADVDRVVLTHLHPDHAGGTTRRTGGEYVPAFPNARYAVQRQEWEDATGNDPQTAKAYRAEADLLPLREAGALDLLDGDVEVCPGVRVFVTPGHTRAHQSVLISSQGETVCFVGDLVPTRHHLPPVYIMAYDLYPRETFRTKRAVLNRAAEEGWLMALPHDPDAAWGRVGVNADGHFTFAEEK